MIPGFYSPFPLRFDVARAPIVITVHFLINLEVQITNEGSTSVKLASNGL